MVALAAVGLLVGASIVAHFVFGLDGPEPENPARQLRLVGIHDSFDVSIRVSEIYDRTELRVGATTVWLMPGRVIVPASLVGVTGSREFLAIPIDSLGESWRRLSTLSFETDFVLDMRECRHAGPHENQILRLFFSESDLDAKPIELCGSGIYNSEAEVTRPIRSKLSTIDSTLNGPDESEVELVTPDDVEEVVLRLESVLLGA